ncbi:MAG: hypothetical protein JW993_13830 [Sedimentisphaerales bacterium]|nr:hypothetical protein [Sedimentisphaerales bacterium]
MQTSASRKSCIVACATLVVLASGVITLAQPPDNAALLYYQAFLLYEKPDATMTKTFDDFRGGEIASNDTIDKFMEKNRPIVDLVARAANITKCDWGYDYSRGVELTMPNFSHFRQIGFLLAAEARWQALGGNYQTALDHCVTMRKMAVHVCDKTLISYLVGVAVDALAYGTSEKVLAVLPSDADALTRFKEQFIQAGKGFPSVAAALTQEAQVCTATMTKDAVPALLKSAREAGADPSEDPLFQRLSQGDEAFFQRNRDYWLSAMARISKLLASKRPYTEMSAALDELAKELNEQMKDNPDATLASMSLSPDSMKRIYLLTVRKDTHLNVLLTAIDLYIAKAKTGRLPDALPADSPPDLFSGKPFTYTMTAEGFMLRSQNPDSKRSQFEFKTGQ